MEGEEELIKDEEDAQRLSNLRAGEGGSKNGSSYSFDFEASG